MGAYGSEFKTEDEAEHRETLRHLKREYLSNNKNHNVAYNVHACINKLPLVICLLFALYAICFLYK